MSSFDLCSNYFPPKRGVPVRISTDVPATMPVQVRTGTYECRSRSRYTGPRYVQPCRRAAGQPRRGQPGPSWSAPSPLQCQGPQGPAHATAARRSLVHTNSFPACTGTSQAGPFLSPGLASPPAPRQLLSGAVTVGGLSMLLMPVFLPLFLSVCSGLSLHPSELPAASARDPGSISKSWCQ